MVFSKQRRQLWAFLSLWSLLALAAPQLLMACPMSGGGFGSTPALMATTQCCAKKATDNTSGAMKGCCKKVPLPPSDTSGDDGKITLSKSSPVGFAPLFFHAASTPAIVATTDFFAPQFSAIAFSPTPFPRLISQQTPTLFSGRAPPI